MIGSGMGHPINKDIKNINQMKRFIQKSKKAVYASCFTS
jgi:hypothetical protein